MIRSKTPERLEESWRRCLAVGLTPESVGPVRVMDPDELRERRRRCRLGTLVSILAEALGADDASGRLLVITDAEGTVLWRRGTRRALTNADRIGFYEGAGWTDGEVGTNAIGQSLFTGGTCVVRGTEHFAHSHADWDCLSTPIHCPQTGEVMGAVDLSQPSGTCTGDAVRMVELAAHLVRGSLDVRVERAVPQVEVRLLSESPAVRVDGRWRRLGSRAAEILALLERRPGGWGAEELAVELYGFDGNPGTVRSEIHRLRRLLGPHLDTGPYRWAETVEVTSDVARLRQAVVEADPTSCLALCGPGLLPRSTAPAVTAWRAEIDRLVSQVIHRHGQGHQLRQWMWLRGEAAVAS